MLSSFAILSGLVAGLSSVALAGKDKGGGGGGCCKFTLYASAPFDCPAGQLEDGQIRFNGSYPTSSFCIDSRGGITDGNGFGCIVTGPPETQIQCDHGKEPEKGFAISNNKTLTYHGSSKFFACPATDTEYNIYVSPNFGQLKCVPVTLTTDGCASDSSPPTCPSSPAPAPSTIIITQAVTITHTAWNVTTEIETETETEWISMNCQTSMPSYTPTTKPCARCTKTSTSKTWSTPSLTGTGTGGCAKCTGGGGHWNTTTTGTNKTKNKPWGYGSHAEPTADEEN